MKKIIYVVLCITVVLFSGLESCKFKNETKGQDNQTVDVTHHNSGDSADWQGSYTGIIPCADCSGIRVRITLNEDRTYQASYLYMDKNNTPETFSGKFKLTWDDSGSIIIILDSKGLPPYYEVGENSLIQLDMRGKRITGKHADKYILTKTDI